MKKSPLIKVKGVGEVLVLPPFRSLFNGKGVRVVDSNAKPSYVFRLLDDRYALVMIGDYRRIDGICRYVEKFSSKFNFSQLAATNRYGLSKLREVERKKLIWKLGVIGHNDRIYKVKNSPDISGISAWLGVSEAVLKGKKFFIPYRKLTVTLNDLKRQKEGFHIEALSKDITILPNVYKPLDQSVINLLADHLGDVTGKTVLDVGTGAGVQALIVSEGGAKKVVATDISPQAVRNAKLNVDRLGLTNVDVRRAGSLFAPIKKGETFDLILFNPPWYLGKPTSIYDAGIFDEGYQVITGFVEGAGRFLKPDGKILLHYSNFSQLTGEGALDYLAGVLDKSGLEIVNRWKTRRLSRKLGKFETIFLFEVAKRRKSKQAGYEK